MCWAREGKFGRSSVPRSQLQHRMDGDVVSNVLGFIKMILSFSRSTPRKRLCSGGRERKERSPKSICLPPFHSTSTFNAVRTKEAFPPTVRAWVCWWGSEQQTESGWHRPKFIWRRRQNRYRWCRQPSQTAGIPDTKDKDEEPTRRPTPNR